MIALTINLNQTTVVFEIGDVEDLVVSKPVFGAEREVRFEVVEGAEEAGEGDVAVVVEVGAAED
jgi:hypothetical protein